MAALAVVLYHFSTHFVEVYGPSVGPGWSFSQGFFGVKLFFVISGFVIYLTLNRSANAVDFLVARFARLMPTFWCAVLLTFVLTQVLTLPGRTVGFDTLLLNLTYLRSFFAAPYVDGVYWTLEVEWVFYLLMASLLALRRHQWVPWTMVVLLVLRTMLRLDLIQMDGRFMPYEILVQLPWFALGIALYLWTRGTRWPAALLATLALSNLLLFEGRLFLLVALACTGLVGAAAAGRLPWLCRPWLLWLGAVSYPLYLVHQNIGFALMLQLQALGLPANLGLLLALLASLGLAALLTRHVEHAAQAAIKRRWRALRAAQSA